MKIYAYFCLTVATLSAALPMNSIVNRSPEPQPFLGPLIRVAGRVLPFSPKTVPVRNLQPTDVVLFLWLTVAIEGRYQDRSDYRMNVGMKENGYAESERIQL